MKHTEKFIKEMYDYTKELYEENWYFDIYDLRRLYTDIAEKFNLDIAFWIDGNEDGGDDTIYCYVYVNNIWSIVFNRSIRRYTDWNFYKDTVNYLLELEEEAQKIREKLLTFNQ